MPTLVARLRIVLQCAQWEWSRIAVIKDTFLISNTNVEILASVLDLPVGHYNLKHYLLSGQV